MSSTIDHQITGPLLKPEKTGPKKPKYIKTRVDRDWMKTRAQFLKGRSDHAGYYVCETCTTRTPYPEVDHIRTRGSSPELKHELSNLRILCNDCHRRRHS